MGEVARERLKAIEDSQDGFDLAEKDLQLSLGPFTSKSEHVFIEMLTSPKAKNREYERVAFYFIRISNEGYNVMRKLGRIEEKNDLGGRIEIYRKEVFLR